MKTPTKRRRRARLTAPPGQCPYCDRRRRYAAKAMMRKRQKETEMTYWITYATATHVEADGPYNTEEDAQQAFSARQGWYDSYGAAISEAVNRHEAITAVKDQIRTGLSN